MGGGGAYDGEVAQEAAGTGSERDADGGGGVDFKGDNVEEVGGGGLVGEVGGDGAVGGDELRDGIAWDGMRVQATALGWRELLACECSQVDKNI
jgi:hypothetical protein